MRKTEVSPENVTTITLYENELELYYTLEHHVRDNTYSNSHLKPFIRHGNTNNRTMYKRELSVFYDAIDIDNNKSDDIDPNHNRIALPPNFNT